MSSASGSSIGADGWCSIVSGLSFPKTTAGNWIIDRVTDLLWKKSTRGTSLVMWSELVYSSFIRLLCVVWHAAEQTLSVGILRHIMSLGAHCHAATVILFVQLLKLVLALLCISVSICVVPSGLFCRSISNSSIWSLLNRNSGASSSASVESDIVGMYAFGTRFNLIIQKCAHCWCLLLLWAGFCVSGLLSLLVSSCLCESGNVVLCCLMSCRERTVLVSVGRTRLVPCPGWCPVLHAVLVCRRRMVVGLVRGHRDMWYVHGYVQLAFSLCLQVFWYRWHRFHWF